MNRLFVTVLLLLVTGGAQTASARQSLREGKVARDGFDLYYTVVGSDGPYALILSGGPGEEVRSMQRVVDELSKRFRCVMLEQRGTGRSRLSRYDASTINLNAYIEDIEALRKHCSRLTPLVSNTPVRCGPARNMDAGDDWPHSR